MQKVFGTFNNCPFFHIGGVLINDSKEEDHLEHLKNNHSKDRRGRPEIETFKRHLQYPEHIISDEGIYPLKEKVA